MKMEVEGKTEEELYKDINDALEEMFEVKTVKACPLNGGAKTKKNKNRRKIMKGGEFSAFDKDDILRTISHLIVISILGSAVYYGSLITIIESLFNLSGLGSLFNSIYPIITAQLTIIANASATSVFSVAGTAGTVAASTGSTLKGAAITVTSLKYGIAAAKTNVEVIKGVLRVMLNPTTIFKELRCALACTVGNAKSTVSAVSRAFSCASNLVKLSSDNIIDKFKIFNGKFTAGKKMALSKMSESITSVKEDVAPVSDAYIGLVDIVFGILTMYKNVETIPDNLSGMEKELMSQLMKAFEFKIVNAEKYELLKQDAKLAENEENKENFRELVLKNFPLRNPTFPNGCLPCDGGPVRSPARERSQLRRSRSPAKRTIEGSPPPKPRSYRAPYGPPPTKPPGVYDGGSGRKRKRSNSRTKKQRRSLHKKRRATHKMRRR